MNTIGMGNGSGSSGSSGSVDVTSTLYRSSVEISEKYYDTEEIKSVAPESLDTYSTQYGANGRQLFMYADRGDWGDEDVSTDSAWFSYPLFYDRLEDGSILCFAIDRHNDYRIYKITKNDVTTVIKGLDNTDYGDVYMCDGSSKVVKRENLYYFVYPAPGTWDIYLCSIDIQTASVTQMYKLTSDTGTGNNYHYIQLLFSGLDNDILYISYVDSNNPDPNRIIKYRLSTNEVESIYDVPTYSNTVTATYSTDDEHGQFVPDSDDIGSNPSYPISYPNISCTYRFGQHTLMIKDKAIICGYRQDKHHRYENYAYSFAFGMFQVKDTGDSLQLTKIEDNIVSISNTPSDQNTTPEYFHDNSATYFTCELSPNNYIFGFIGIPGLNYEQICGVISMYDFRYDPDTAEYTYHEVFSIPRNLYMVYTNGTIPSYPKFPSFMTNDDYDSHGGDGRLSFSHSHFNGAIGINDNDTNLIFSLSIFYYQFLYQIKATVTDLTEETDRRYGEYKYNAKEGDILYGSEPITRVQYNSEDWINVNSRTYTITKDGPVTIEISHDIFRYHPILLVRDKSGVFINLNLQFEENRVSGKMIKDMKINDAVVEENGEQTITDDSLLMDRIYINMEEM